MSKNLFSSKDIRQLVDNIYVKAVSEKAITYTDEFKELFISESQKGKFPREIFEQYGFDVEMVGIHRIRSAAKRWKAAFAKEGVMGLRDTRPGNSGRILQRERTLEESYKQLEAQNNLLRAENELLKKIRFAERGQKKK